MADSLNAVPGKSLGDQGFDDPVLGGDFTLLADVRIEFIGKVGELGPGVDAGGEDKSCAYMLDRTRPGDLKPLQTVESFLPGALKLIYVLPCLVRSQLVFRF